jgi:hypothetical protein
VCHQAVDSISPVNAARTPRNNAPAAISESARGHQFRQMSLNGSGLIAVYRTVLVMLAWPR